MNTMTAYQDITLLPDQETDLYFLWQKVFQQVHLALVEIKDEVGQVSVGLSWPNYRYSEDVKHLGNKVRLFAIQESDLVGLDINKWLSRLTDYVHITSIKPVPENIVGYACYSRVMPKSSNARLARRKAKREDISYEMALDKVNGREEQREDLPYIWSKSLSGGQMFPLFIERTEFDTATVGNYSCYGLSKTSTVPCF